MKSRNGRHLLMLCAAVCTAMLLTGCGKEQTIHTGADAVSGEKAGQETDAGKEGQQEDIAELAERMEQQTSAARAQMEIDDATRRELTAELLEEENMDTSVMEQGRATKGCSFDIPEGFEESEETAGMYVTKRYPIDASAICYAEMEEDLSMQLLTGENFKEQTEAGLKQAYDEETEVVLDSFEHVKISGYPAFRILCHYKVGEVEMTQLAYVINADKSYMVTYSQTNDYDYMEAYEASAATIRVK